MLGGATVAGSSGSVRLPKAVQHYAVLHGDRVLLSCGYWDGSIRCHAGERGPWFSCTPHACAGMQTEQVPHPWSYPPQLPPSSSRNPPTPDPAVDDGRPLQSLCYHRDVVSCLAASSDGRAVASGSRDTTVMLWDVNLGYGKGESRNVPDTTVMLQDVNLGPLLCCAGPHSPSCPCAQRPRAGVRTTATTTPRCRWCRDHATCCTDTKTRWVCGSGGKGLSVRGWGVCVKGRCGCGWVGGWISEGGGVGARAQCMQMRAGTASGHALCRNTRARLRPLASLHAAHASPAVHAAQVTCIALSQELDLIVSGAADGTILVHTLMQGRWVD